MIDRNSLTEYASVKDGLLKDFATSHWLKDAIHALENRDPCDALTDAEVLLGIQRLRVKQALYRREIAAPAGRLSNAGVTKK